jgi:spermidine/putrescine transport system substrate-binding protein
LKNYDVRFLNQSFDPNNKYSVPYFWGTLGIVYNDKYIKAGEITKWDDLWKSKYKKSLLLVDSARDDLGFSLVSLSKSVNTTNLGNLQAAKAKLDTLMPNVKAILNDEIGMYMQQNEAKIAVTYSGAAADMMSEDKHLHYVLPKEGGNLWFDDLAIPKTAKHVKAAHEFINFISDAKNAAKNAEYIGYATPNKEAMKLLPKSITLNKQFYPDDSMISKLQVYKDLGQYWTEKYNDLFLEFKINNK